MRTLAVITACWVLLCSPAAIADAVAVRVHQLGNDRSARVRLAAVVSLSKERDPRAVIAVAGALRSDRDKGIRRVSALALARMINARTARDAIALALSALEGAAANDRSADVSAAAANTLRRVRRYRRLIPRHKPGPPVFVNIDRTIDQSKHLTKNSAARLNRIVKRNVERTGYATSWPGGLPTSADLASSRSRAFIVASTVKRITITKVGSRTQIGCTFSIRIAPWMGRDGGERWEANRAASASGSAKATTGSRPRDVSHGVYDCLEAVAEDLTSRRVVPFLRRIAAN